MKLDSAVTAVEIGAALLGVPASVAWWLAQASNSLAHFYILGPLDTHQVVLTDPNLPRDHMETFAREGPTRRPIPAGLALFLEQPQTPSIHQSPMASHQGWLVFASNTGSGSAMATFRRERKGLHVRCSAGRSRRAGG